MFPLWSTSYWNLALFLFISIITKIHTKGLLYTIYQLQQMSTNRYPLPESTDSQNPDSLQIPSSFPSKESICQTFTKHQRKLCHQHFRLMESVVSGFLLGLNECQYQFAAHIWNCKGHNVTLSSRKSKSKQENKTYLDKLISRGTPEAAYVLAVISAGVAHQVTKACSKGVHDSCGCDRTIYDTPESSSFKWSGCSHNIHFGAAFTRQFLDISEKSRITKRPEMRLTNLHNNHVGRQSVVAKMGKKCKCHGVSGSCEMKTCIRALPDFREVGSLLKSRFHKAMRVNFLNSRLVPHYPETKMFTDSDLIYLNKSPNYCVHNPKTGSLGTQGRKCAEVSLIKDQSLPSEGSCESLCCGRGHQVRSYIRVEQCRCKFHWCCDVKCDLCKKELVESVCN